MTAWMRRWRLVAASRPSCWKRWQGSRPAFFETVLELLYRMGYGTSKSDLKRAGRPGDGGIDGVISSDRLGLEKVYVQADDKEKPMRHPEVQAFYGALAGQRANKGVLTGTSRPRRRSSRGPSRASCSSTAPGSPSCQSNTRSASPFAL